MAHKAHVIHAVAPVAVSANPRRAVAQAERLAGGGTDLAVGGQGRARPPAEHKQLFDKIAEFAPKLDDPMDLWTLQRAVGQWMALCKTFTLMQLVIGEFVI